MKSTDSMTASELVELHNALCPADQKIEGEWKKSKDLLIEKISDFEKVMDKNVTISSEVMKLLMDEELSYTDIVKDILKKFPNAKTTARSVASVASVARRKGIEVPKRRG